MLITFKSFLRTPLHILAIFALWASPVFAQSGFDLWRDAFRVSALSQGISAATFDRAFQGVTLNDAVIEHDRYQPEFNKPIWEYLDSAVSERRVTDGRRALRRNRRMLRQIEARYGVDASILVAIWGIESNFGQNRGSFNTIEALATLAYDGRRQRYGESQLIAALKILQNGDVQARDMLGSWAGAMGHTQFIPTSFRSFAVDYDGDGRRNVWGDDPGDALASAANYLARNGWRHGEPWGVEVVLPRGFSYALADVTNRQSAAFWNAQGVRLAGGGRLPDYGNAALLLPAGAGNPVFAVFHNFKVIQRYNNAVSYAMSVGHLSDRIAGGGPFRVPWARDSVDLTLTQTAELQRLLTAKGFSTHGVDGVAGAKTRTAIIAYQRSIGVEPDGFASLALLERLRH